MGFDDRYRVSARAVVMDDRGRILLLEPSYGDGRWGLPGGSAEPGEHLLDALQREMVEELGCALEDVASSHEMARLLRHLTEPDGDVVFGELKALDTPSPEGAGTSPQSPRPSFCRAAWPESTSKFLSCKPGPSPPRSFCRASLARVHLEVSVAQKLRPDLRSGLDR